MAPVRDHSMSRHTCSDCLPLSSSSEPHPLQRPLKGWRLHRNRPTSLPNRDRQRLRGPRWTLALGRCLRCRSILMVLQLTLMRHRLRRPSLYVYHRRRARRGCCPLAASCCLRASYLRYLSLARIFKEAGYACTRGTISRSVARLANSSPHLACVCCLVYVLCPLLFQSWIAHGLFAI